MAGTLTDDDWLTLGRAPLAVFGLVASADGNVSAAERKSFVTGWVNDPSRFDWGELEFSERYAGALHEALKELPRIEKMQRVRHIGLLRKAARVLKLKVAKQTSRRFAKSLLTLASEIASASRGAPFGLGPRVSPDEEQAMEHIRQILGIRA